MQLLCVVWYLRPLACLYDLLQLGLGHLRGFERSKEEAGQESVEEATAELMRELERPEAGGVDLPGVVVLVGKREAD